MIVDRSILRCNMTKSSAEEALECSDRFIKVLNAVMKKITFISDVIVHIIFFMICVPFYFVTSTDRIIHRRSEWNSTRLGFEDGQ